MANTKITSRVIAADAVLTANITDANVTTAKIADDAVTSAKLDTNIAIDGVLTVGQSIVHQGDTNTSLDFGTDTQTFYAGATRALDFTASTVVINEGSADVDFRVESNGSANMLFVDGGNNEVLVQKAASGGTATAGSVLIVEGDDNTELSILGGSSSILAINFGHSGDVDDAIIAYNTTSGSENMAFTVNAAERMRITSGGDVEVKVGNLVIGTAGKGIDFSAQTASDTGNTTAEILDHYEEGSWTPAFEGTSTSVTVHSAKYTRIGRIVHVTCYFSGMTASNNGSMQKVTGLPFDHTASTYAALSLGYCGTVNLNDALPIITSNYIYFHQNDGNSAVLTRADFYSRAGGVFPLLMSGVYMTDE